MKRFLLFLIFGFSSYTGNTQIFNPSLPWVLVEEEEFENQIDTNFWKKSEFSPFNTRVFPLIGSESQYYTDFDINNNHYVTGYNSEIGKEILNIRATEDSILGRIVEYHPDDFQFIIKEDIGDTVTIDNLHQFEYQSGELVSRRRYKYGFFSMGFQMPAGFGYWPAFWLHGSGSEGSNEVDIIEYEGDHVTHIPTNIHYPYAKQNGINHQQIDSTVLGMHTTWNVLALDWQPHPVNDTVQILRWIFNNQVFRVEILHVDFVPMNIFLNFALGGPPFQEMYTAMPLAGQRLIHLDLSATNFPADYKIDFVRIYQRLDCNREIHLDSYDNESINSSIEIGGVISIAGNNEEVVVDGPSGSIFTGLVDNERLDLIATDEISILPGFHSELGSDFHARLMECPYNGKAPIEEYLIDQDYDESLNSVLYTSNEQQTISNEMFAYEKEYLKNNPVFSCYPNPTENNIYIKGSSNNSVKIQLINNLGQTLLVNENFKVNNFIDIDNLPNGLYFLIIEDGNFVFKEKIVKY